MFSNTSKSLSKQHFLARVSKKNQKSHEYLQHTLRGAKSGKSVVYCSYLAIKVITVST
jgi:hypothetical protein